MKIITTKSGKLLIAEDCPGIHMLIKHTKSLKIVGKLSELKDKDVEEFVDRYNNHAYRDYVNTKIFYADVDTNYIYLAAKESFLSLLAANGLNTNKEFLIVKIL